MSFTQLLSYAAAFLALPAAAFVIGLRSLDERDHPSLLPPVVASTLAAPRPALDRSRPTVVVLLGTDLTEITDALGPYEMFARAGKYNVVMAAAQRQPTLLTGGLRILPHYSLAEIDTLLGGAPAVVVIPNLPNADAGMNRPVIDWIRQSAAAGSLIHSWCKGAMALAETGLLDGHTATAHWGDIPKLEKRYPNVTWVRGVRWIDRGQYVMSAGITSGIDASLRVLIRLAGDSVARRVAREMRYPNYHFALDPTVEQYQLQPVDLVKLANAAFRVNRPRLGVALYDGIGELDLSNVYDAHVHLMTIRVETVALHEGPIVTEHGLTLYASATPARLSRLDRFMVQGVDARARAATLVTAIEKAAPGLRAEYVHADQPQRFGLEPMIEDLARTADAMTARFALKRMEFRSNNVRFEGSPLPWPAIGFALLLGLLGLIAFTMTIARRLTMQKHAHTHSPTHNHGAAYESAREIAQPAPGGKVVSVALEAAQTEWEFVPGQKTLVWSYNGQVPGPTLDGNVGDVLEIRLTNRLAEATTIHWHGIRLPAPMDGTENVQQLIAPGETFRYRFLLRDAGTFWYHPHFNETEQLERGLYGALIVRAANEPQLDAERVLVLDDVKLDRTSQIQTLGGFVENHDGRQGRTLLVNGKQQPEFTMAAGQIERWRIANVASARYVRLSIGGRPFTLLGTDGGLLEAPFVLKEILLAPADRVDIAVGPFAEGQTIQIESRPYDRRTIARTRVERFATVQVTAAQRSNALIPTQLRSIERLVTGEAAVTREVHLGVRPSLRNGLKFVVNGEAHHRDKPVKLGELQVWDIVNDTLMDHPFHLHGYFFQVVSVNGKSPAFLSWEDTINIPPRSRVRIAWVPEDRTGEWMYHCHILEHHASGMMGHFEVVR